MEPFLFGNYIQSQQVRYIMDPDFLNYLQN